MVNITVSAAGVQGPRGAAFLSGVGAPVTNQVNSIDGDFYLDTTNVGFYYGPRTNGLWGTPHPFGNSLNGVPLVNITATTGPTSANDNTQGYSRGSYWINTTNNLTYICTNAATGAAIWQQTLAVSSTVGGLSISGTPGFNLGLNASSGTAASWTPGFGQTTGLLSGGQIAFVSGTQFSIASGFGQIADFVTTPATPTLSKVTITGQTFTMTGGQLASTINWILIDVNGNVILQSSSPTPAQRRQFIVLGLAIAVSGVLVNAASVATYVSQIGDQLYDHMYALGSFVSSLNPPVLSANGANLNLNLAAGLIFSPGANYSTNPNDPHNIATVSETPVSFFRQTHVSGSQVAATLVDPANFDNNGVLTAVGGGAGSSTLQRVIMFASKTAGRQIVVQYGNIVYASLSAAQAAVGQGGFVVNPDSSNGILLAYIAINKSCASLQDTTTSAIITASKFATP